MKLALRGPRQRRIGADPFAWRTVLEVVWHDLFGARDVRETASPSYVWLIEQLGRLGLGFIATIALGWSLGSLFADGGSDRLLLGIVTLLASAGVIALWGWWAWVDYRDTKARWSAVFPLDELDLRLTAGTGALFFLTGIALAIASYRGLGSVLLALVVFGGAAAYAGYRALRQKIALQQAGLPYGYRLADFASDVSDADTQAINGFARPAETGLAFRHLIVTGPGKADLAVGVGTEFAYRLGKVRYLDLAGLLQLAGSAPAPAGTLVERNGSLLWPLTEVDLLVVDDVDAGLDTKALLTPEALETALEARQGTKPLAWLAGRRSIWVLGDAASPEGWQATLARLIGTDTRTIKTVRLTAKTVGSPAT